MVVTDLTVTKMGCLRGIVQKSNAKKVCVTIPKTQLKQTSGKHLLVLDLPQRRIVLHNVQLFVVDIWTFSKILFTIVPCIKNFFPTSQVCLYINCLVQINLFSFYWCDVCHMHAVQ